MIDKYGEKFGVIGILTILVHIFRLNTWNLQVRFRGCTCGGTFFSGWGGKWKATGYQSVIAFIFWYGQKTNALLDNSQQGQVQFNPLLFLHPCSVLIFRAREVQYWAAVREVNEEFWWVNGCGSLQIFYFVALGSQPSQLFDLRPSLSYLFWCLYHVTGANNPATDLVGNKITFTL